MKDWIRTGAAEEMEEFQEGLAVCLRWKAFRDVPFLRHAFSTRQGGVSRGFLSTMNFSFDRGDDPEHVRENYRRIAAAIGVSPDSFVLGHQTHTVNILAVTEQERGAGVVFPRPWTDIDGLVTNVPGITLVTFHADCLPVWLVDRKRKAIGLFHAGWKGTVEGIAAKGLGIMGERYGTCPEDVTAAIGPGICMDCYEVGEDVAERFFSLFPNARQMGIIKAGEQRADGSHWQLSLSAANRELLLQAGILEKEIHVSEICTRCNPDRLFSHRAHGVRRGLNAAFLAIAESGNAHPFL